MKWGDRMISFLLLIIFILLVALADGIFAEGKYVFNGLKYQAQKLEETVTLKAKLEKENRDLRNQLQEQNK